TRPPRPPPFPYTTLFRSGTNHRPFLRFSGEHVARANALGQRGGNSGGGGAMLLVTGGAGFIGSNLVAGLNEAGRTDIVVHDSFEIGRAHLRTPVTYPHRM